MEQLLFTPAALLSILMQIDELRNADIQITENLDGSLQLSIGESTYIIKEDTPVEIAVDTQVVEQVEDANESAYLDLQDSGDIEMEFVTDIDEEAEPVQAGFLSELFRTLAVGGMVRLTTKMLTPKEQQLFDKYTSEHMTRAERDAARRNNVYQFRGR